MKRELTCIICPRGCALEVTGEGEDLTVCGNACPRGGTYAREECTDPHRTVTSVVRVENRPYTMLSVKTAAPVPRDAVPAVMRKIRETAVKAPVALGTVLIEDVFGTEIVATETVE